jgi:hypothetical protein
MARLWLRVSLETLIGLAMVVVADWAISGQNQNLSFVTYVIWCVALVEAARHGPWVGLILATLVCLGEGLVLHAQMLYEPAPRNAGVTLAFVAAMGLTVAVGQVAEAQRRRQARQVVRLRDLTTVLKAESASLASTAESVTDLERRIAQQTITVGTLNEPALGLESVVPTEIPRALLEMLAQCLPASAASVYAFEHGQLIAQAHVPASGSAPDAQLVINHPLVQHVMSTGAAWNIRDALAARSFAAVEAPLLLMAAPLKGPDDAIFGIVTVEHMPFLCFDASAERVLDMVAQWASRSLSHATVWHNVAAAAVSDDVAVLTFPQTMRHLWYEIGRARRFDRPLAVVVLHVREHPEYQGRIAEQIRRSLRDIDTVGRHYLAGRFVCVLPQTSAAEAHLIGKQLVRGIRRNAVGASYGLATLDVRTDSTASLLAEADAISRSPRD